MQQNHVVRLDRILYEITDLIVDEYFTLLDESADDISKVESVCCNIIPFREVQEFLSAPCAGIRRQNSNTGMHARSVRGSSFGPRETACFWIERSVR